MVVGLEKTERAIKNGHSMKNTCNILHNLQNEKKQNKKHNTENIKDEQHTDGESRYMRRVRSPSFV
jgi:hypothetical protein